MAQHPKKPEDGKRNRIKRGKRHIHYNSRKKLSPRHPPRNATAPKENYENLVLNYLNKLKGLFSYKSSESNQQPKPGSRANQSSTPLTDRQGPPVHSSSSCKKINRSDEMSIQDKVYNVVSAAIEYGFANNVLEKRGNFFALKKNSRIAQRQPTPGPSGRMSRSFQQCQCNRCKSQGRSATQMHLQRCQLPPHTAVSRPKTVNENLRKRESATMHPKTFGGSCSTEPFRKRTNCHCDKCFAAGGSRFNLKK